MPNTVKKIKGMWRVVDKATGRITKNASGTAVDGGGKKTEASAQKQASAINLSQARQRGEDVPPNPNKAARKMTKKARFE